MTQETPPKTRILVAEDDPVSRRVLESFLTKWGFEVVGAADGLEAAQILGRTDAPQLAILDWMMPGMEGPQICRQVRANAGRPYTYIMLLTARTQKADVFQGLESGADDYLTKPFDSQELRARLHVGQRILDLQSGLIAAKEKLRFQATHDPLTRLWNRGAIVDAVDREASRQTRERGSFGVILMDLDHFKRVNDTFGHLAGDAVLKETGRRIAGSLRPYDIVGRYGGEEFLIVAPSCSESDVLNLAERIRKAIAARPVDTDAGPVQITASCGVCVGGHGRLTTSKAILEKSDEALYQAKDKGRNRSYLVEERPSSVSPATWPKHEPAKPSSR
ncbi:MAG TPA: diguanylate cyclase [Verrucomicrobiae bacterium]|nr:diguanylate cyclase [Verrucomicrobiae bacterium]